MEIIIERMKEDINTVFLKDPAARTSLEVICLYPGIQAIWLFRIAHFFWVKGFLFIGRLISHLARFLTNVEIHPGATIGRRFIIDHGSGVVIGETTEIGDDVLLYAGVVLGGTTLTKGKRHPTIGNNVVIGTHAVILGSITIGNGAVIGAGSVVVRQVLPNTTVAGVPARIINPPPQRENILDHGKIPDSLEDIIVRIKLIEDKINK